MVEVVFARPRLVAGAVPRVVVARAFSTMLLMRFDDLTGETGRAMPDLTGDRWDRLVVIDEAAAAPLGAIRELDEAGERTWAGWLRAISAAGPRRAFLGLSMCEISFSLSPPEMSRLCLLEAVSMVFWGGY